MASFRRVGLVPGVYDEVLTARLQTQLAALGPEFKAVRAALTRENAGVGPLASAIRAALDLGLAKHRHDPERALALATAVMRAIHETSPGALAAEELEFANERLEAILPLHEGDPSRPRGSLHASSLIVNAEGDALLDHLRSEFATADRVDLLCAFIKLSGFEKLRASLELLTSTRGKKLRLLTTTYMAASDAKAVERFASLPNTEVRVSFDETHTRLHAKAWVFHRESGYSTAYVGSSNLSHSAQTEGLEWNVRLTESDQPALVAQMQEVFEQYWEDHALFEPFRVGESAHRERLRRALSPELRQPQTPDFLPEVSPYPWQVPVLQELEAARALSRSRNLLVAATGTGKTIMAALDYRALRARKEVDTLLFVAHRREILEQSLGIFRSALQLRDFGELLFQGQRLQHGRHVFASIDSIADDRHLDPSSFDMVIIDEAHHSAARTWTELLRRVKPRQLLGLTGTPERADGWDYDEHFPRPWVGNLRVWNAIPNALVPFRYYALDVKGVDLRDVAWVAGGYAPQALSGKLVGAAEVFVQRAVEAVNECIARPADMRAIAFCVDVRHAEEVDQRFAAKGYQTRVLTGETPGAERGAARDDLNAGRIQILCVVDLYNEGVDVPNVNTLFFFRPTESATVFLQQLGRGLRRAHGKSELVVFDLTARQHANFRFDRRLRATLGHTPRELRQFVERGFGRLPAGCHFQFDEIARADILEQLKRSIPSDLTQLKTLLAEPAHAELSLEQFLHHTDVDLETIYGSNRSWTLVRKWLGLERRAIADDEAEALACLAKLLHVGDSLRLDAWERLADGVQPVGPLQVRLMNMLFNVLLPDHAHLPGAWELWMRFSLLREEVKALAGVLRRENALLTVSDLLEPEVPLVVHGRYLSGEISAAFDHRTTAGAFRSYYTGVEPTADRRYDLLLTTVEKSLSVREHLRYRDFPLSERLFQWQSKGSTTQASKNGRRLLDPRGQGCTPLLFVRERADQRPGVTMAFHYLGPVDPSNPVGERPITIDWQLRYPMPHHLLEQGRVAA